MTTKRKVIMAYDLQSDTMIELTQARYDEEIKALNRLAVFRSEVKKMILNTESDAEYLKRIENEKIVYEHEKNTAREAAE